MIDKVTCASDINKHLYMLLRIYFNNTLDMHTVFRSIFLDKIFQHIYNTPVTSQHTNALDVQLVITTQTSKMIYVS